MKRISLLLAATTMLWGSIYVCNKMLLDTIPGFTLLCLRYCIAAVVMLSLLAIQRKKGYGKIKPIEAKDGKYVVLFGLGAYVISVSLQLFGTKLFGAAISSLINCLNPIFICFFAVLLLHEQMTVKKIICIVCAAVGAACIVGGDLTGGTHITGMVLSMGSALSWGIVSVCARSLTKKYDALTITTYGICIAVIATLPLMIWERYHSVGGSFLQPKCIILILTYGVHSPAKMIL